MLARRALRSGRRAPALGIANRSSARAAWLPGASNRTSTITGMVLPVRSPLPERIGRYRIEGKLGEGGMGVVYAARDERLDRPVALKTIRGDSDDTARKRLWREARAAAGITHPNICQLYEIEETADGLYIAMELLAGESLAARLGRGPLSGADASPHLAADPRRARGPALRAGSCTATSSRRTCS